MLNLKNNVKEAMDSIRLINLSVVNPEELKSIIEQNAHGSGTPVSVHIDEMKSGGVFGTKYPCVVINHPNPPTTYFSIVVVCNGNILSTYYFGTSKNCGNLNLRDYYNEQGGLLNKIKSSLIKADEMALRTEQGWYQDVLDAIQNVCE